MAWRQKGKALWRTLRSPTTGTSRASAISTAMATATFYGVKTPGTSTIWEMNGLGIKTEGTIAHAPVGNDWHVQDVGDYNGEGKSDILWRQDSGQVYVWEMNGLQVTAEGVVSHAAVSSDWHAFSQFNFV